MKRLLIGLLLLAAASSTPAANVPFNTFTLGLTSSSTLAGTESLVCVQGGVSTKCTPAQIEAYVATQIVTQPLTWTAQQTFVAPILGTPASINLANALGLPCAAMPALTGGVTSSAGSCATTLRALVSGDIPNNAANTSGTAANLSGTPALPNGTTATTQTTGDSTAKVATDGFVAAAIAAGAPPTGAAGGVLAGTYPNPSFAGGTTGTGAVVQATSPSLTTPNLGTPSANNAANVTNEPLSQGDVANVCDSACGTISLSGLQTIDGQSATAGQTLTMLTQQGSITASMSGATMTVSAVSATTNTPASGQIIGGSGVTFGTTITGACTGSLPTLSCPISPSQTISSETMSTNSSSQNGPWFQQTTAWTRAPLYATGNTTQVNGFTYSFSRNGTKYQGSFWKQTNNATITIDTTPTTWVQVPIQNGALAQAPASTIKGNNAASTGVELDLTVAQVQTLLGLSPVNNVQLFTSSGTWNAPAAIGGKTLQWLFVRACGGGGSGGTGVSFSVLGVAGSGGGGGGAGACKDKLIPAATAGSSQAVTVGAGGTAVTGQSGNSAGSNGVAGGNSTFGSLVTGFHGGRGGSGSSGAAAGSGAGAGVNAAGGDATGATGGTVSGVTNAGAVNGVTGNGVANPTGGASGGGSGSTGTGGTGGSSNDSGAGGAGGGGLTTVAGVTAGNGGGEAEQAGPTGPAGGASGTNGPNGAAGTSPWTCGTGGAGGSGGSAGNGGNGGTGGLCAGGAGSGASATGTSGTSGAGGPGFVLLIGLF